MARYDPDKKPQSIKELIAALEAAHVEVSAQCKGKDWRMTVPVQDDDSDVVIGGAIRHALEFIRRDVAFHEWAQSYLDSARWAGHDRADAIKTELLERDKQLDRLERALITQSCDAVGQRGE